MVVICGLQFLLNGTKQGLAIRAVAQDEETARIMGINFTAVVLITFAIGSALAAFAGLMNGLYYNEINFGIGLYLGVVGFSAAIIGGLGSVYGAILGGFLFAAPADRGRRDASFRQRLQGRVRLRRGHSHHDLAADRADPGKDQRAGLMAPQKPHAALWPGLAALAVATVYLIALLAVERQALHHRTARRRDCRGRRRRLAAAARSGEPVLRRS